MRALRSVGVAVAAAVIALTACSSTPAPAPAPTSPNAPSRVSVAEPAGPATSAAAAATTAARPKPVNHCARNTSAQKAVVSLREQHMWMCARHRVVYSTAITSGMAGQWTRTPAGNYVVQGRVRNTTLVLDTGATYPVKYWIPFDGPLFGFHDSSWQHFPYGSAKYRTNGSHGCVHMPLKAIAFFYRWVARPTAVHIA